MSPPHSEARQPAPPRTVQPVAHNSSHLLNQNRHTSRCKSNTNRFAASRNRSSPHAKQPPLMNPAHAPLIYTTVPGSLHYAWPDFHQRRRTKIVKLPDAFDQWIEVTVRLQLARCMLRKSRSSRSVYCRVRNSRYAPHIGTKSTVAR